MAEAPSRNPEMSEQGYLEVDSSVTELAFDAGHDGAAYGPLAWGQHFIWRILDLLAPHDEHLNMDIVVAVPPGASTEHTLHAVTTLISRHQSLRTCYILKADGPQQRTLTRGAIELRFCEADGLSLDTATGQLYTDLARRRFDLSAGAPVRVGICTVAGNARVVVLVLSHVVTDAWGLAILREELTELLMGAHVSSLGERGRQPAAQAAYESSETGQEIEEDSLNHWRDRISRFPRTMFDVPQLPSASPRFWQGGLTSPRMGLAAEALAQRFRTSTTSVILGVLGLLFRQRTGHEECAMTLRVANRFDSEIERAVGHFTQEVPVVFSTDQRSIEVTVRAANAEILASLSFGQCSPTKVLALMSEDGLARGTVTTIDAMLNSIPGLAPRPRVPSSPAALSVALEGLSSQQSFRWVVKRDSEEVKALVNSWLPGGISLLADTTFLTPSDIHALLVGAETILVRAAEGQDDPLDTLEALGLSVPARDADWVRRGSGWICLGATAAMVARQAGVPREAVTAELSVKTDWLTVYIDAPDVSLEELVHRCAADMVHDETVSLPDEVRLISAPGHEHRPLWPVIRRVVTKDILRAHPTGLISSATPTD